MLNVIRFCDFTADSEPKISFVFCGACRQVLLEYEQLAGTDAQVLLAGAEDIYIIPSIHSLMPLAFVDFD